MKFVEMSVLHVKKSGEGLIALSAADPEIRIYRIEKEHNRHNFCQSSEHRNDRRFACFKVEVSGMTDILLEIGKSTQGEDDSSGNRLLTESVSTFKSLKSAEQSSDSTRASGSESLRAVQSVGESGGKLVEALAELEPLNSTSSELVSSSTIESSGEATFPFLSQSSTGIAVGALAAAEFKNPVRAAGTMVAGVAGLQLMDDSYRLYKSTSDLQTFKYGSASVADSALLSGGLLKMAGRCPKLGTGLVIGGFFGRLASELIPDK